MSDELLDIYDESMALLGVKPRDRVHVDGDWHKTFHCWIIGRRQGHRFVLFQLRGPDKDVYPDTLDITAAGHIEHGETAREAVRELEEELGISVDLDALVQLGVRCDVLRFRDLRLREFCETFLLRDDRPLDAYALDSDEVAGLVEVELEDGLRLFSGEVEHIDTLALSRRGAQLSLEERTISVRDVVPRVDRYYLKVFIAAERYFEGRAYLAI